MNKSVRHPTANGASATPNARPGTVVPDAPASVALTPPGQDDAFSSVPVGRSAGYDFLLCGGVVFTPLNQTGPSSDRSRRRWRELDVKPVDPPASDPDPT